MHHRIRNRPARLSTAVVAGVALLGACSGGAPHDAEGGVFYSTCFSVPQRAKRAVDLLLVIDNSSATAGHQDLFRANYPALMQALRHLPGGLPDLHVGVVTTEVGVGPYAVPGCSQDGHGGRMHTGDCPSPFGATYLKDVEPSGCLVERDPADPTACLEHDCVEQTCGHETGTWLVVDPETGCPRCRNYHEDHLEEAFACIADVGAGGCPFSQPLEALRQAIGNHVNARFVRDDAFLAIVIITAQDDCSAADTGLFAPADDDSALGPLTSFRCFEHGITCDVSGRAAGPRAGCVARDEPGTPLGAVGGYVDFLAGVKEPQRLLVAAVAGPVAPSPDGVGFRAQVVLDEQQRATLQPSCTTADGGATPSIRLHAFVEAFNEAEDLAAWAFGSSCAADYTPALAGSGSHCCDDFMEVCVPAPLKGCPDPAAAAGLPGDGQPCNDDCLPQCTVTDVHRRGTDQETRAALPHCLQVCPDGPCPGNAAPELAYASGRPNERDYRLPVPACWYVGVGAACDHGEIVVARRENPPLRSFVDVCCGFLPTAETTCDDGLDGDGDCLVDLDDPDCR